MYRHVEALIAGTGWGARALREFEASSRWGLYLPAIFFVGSYVWWRCGPIYTGPALAGFGIASAVLLVRGSAAPRWEKVVWGVLAVLSLSAELAAAQAARTEGQNFLIYRLNGEREAEVRAAGGGPVHSAVMYVMDLDRVNELQNGRIEDGALYAHAIEFVPMGDFGAGAAKRYAVRAVPMRSGVARCRVVFYDRRNTWWEDLQAREVGGRLLQAFRVERHHGRQLEIVQESEDPGFSDKPANQLDWSWANQEP